MTKLKIVLLTCFLFYLFTFTAFAQEQRLMSVQVKEGQLRSAPSFLGKIVTTISYTKQVEVLEEKGAWMRVALPGTSTEGWMHSSALTKKKIILKPGVEDISQAASSDEVALAGKGFNAEVEEQFKSENSNVDYNAVDKMQKIVISQKQMQQFLKGGGLSPEGGSK
jgi:hypothetical protein